MIIEEIVSLAKYSELSGVAAKNDIDAITAFINLGMLELYTRFPIRVEEYAVELLDNITTYDMPSNFMYATSAYKEFTKSGVTQTIDLSINEDTNPAGIFFTDWDTVKVKDPAAGDIIYLTYAIKPTFITAEQALDGETELDLPDTLIDALLSYLGYRAHLGIRSDSQSENNSHWIRFDRNCKRARDLGVSFPVDSMNMLDRLSTRGFA